MSAKFHSLLLFLCLLAFEEMITMMRPAEAALCSSPSRVFRGWCFNGSNCAAICEKEGFLLGECKVVKCICKKNCSGGGGGGGGGQGLPVGGDPGQGPPEGGDPGQSSPDQGPPDGGDGPPDQGSDGGDEPPSV